MSGRRHAYRPSLSDALEERVVLSHAGGPLPLASAHAAALRALPNPHNTPRSLGPVGALGDSYTDEYRFYPPDRSAARNWVEILHSLRGVSFGPYTTRSRGEPRNQGFAYDWARSEATSVDMIQNQLPGLTEQVARGQIRYAWIFIGGNDYLQALDGIQTGTIPISEVPALIAQTEAQVQTNITTAVNTLLAANPNVKLVIATLPDVSIVPIARAAEATPEGRLLLSAVGDSIARDNAVIRNLAENPRVALVDLATVTQQLGSIPSGTVNYGGTTIDLVTPSDDYHHFFLGDDIHIGTVGQSFIANLFTQAIDDKFNAGLRPISPREAIRFARRIDLHSGQGSLATTPH